MEIKVDTFGGESTTKKYGIEVRVGNASVYEDWLEQDEADAIAVQLLHSTALDRVWKDDIIDKLIGLDIIDKDMVMEWALEQMQVDPHT